MYTYYRSQADITVDYRSRYLHSAEATLLLVTRPANGPGGTTVAFSLQSRLTDLVPTVSTDILCSAKLAMAK